MSLGHQCYHVMFHVNLRFKFIRYNTTDTLVTFFASSL